MGLPRGSAIEAKGGKDSFYAVDYAARAASELGADVMKVKLRPDALIAAEVRQLLAELFTDPRHIAVHVHGGVVTLTAKPGLDAEPDLIPAAIQLIWEIDGVVDVAAKLSAAAPA